MFHMLAKTFKLTVERGPIFVKVFSKHLQASRTRTTGQQSLKPKPLTNIYSPRVPGPTGVSLGGLWNFGCMLQFRVNAQFACAQRESAWEYVSSGVPIIREG